MRRGTPYATPFPLQTLAEQAYVAGEGMTATETKAVMLEIAAAYLRLKDWANAEPIRFHSLNEKPPTLVPGKDSS